MKISVRAHPRSKKHAVVERAAGELEIWLGAPAVENRANAALVEILAGYFHVPQSAVRLASGGKSKQKIFEIARPDSSVPGRHRPEAAVPKSTKSSI